MSKNNKYVSSFLLWYLPELAVELQVAVYQKL